MAAPTPELPAFIERQLPAGMKRRAVMVEGMRLHVMEMGEGLPVLLLHGNPTWSFLYRKVAAALAREPLRLVMPDLVGLGFSDRPKSAAMHQLDNHARWIRGLLPALDIGGVVLVVQDWGGPIGLRALADEPKLLRGLVLLNTVTGPPRAGFRPTFFHRFARWPLVSDAVFRLLSFPQCVLWAGQGDRRSIRGEVAAAYRFPLRQVRANAAPLALARMVPSRFDHPSIPALERCRQLVDDVAQREVPAAIVWGERDPILGRVVRHVEKLLPHARVTRTAAGHFLQEEVPDEIAKAVTWVADRVRQERSAPRDPGSTP